MLGNLNPSPRMGLRFVCYICYNLSETSLNQTKKEKKKCFTSYLEIQGSAKRAATTISHQSTEFLATNKKKFTLKSKTLSKLKLC